MAAVASERILLRQKEDELKEKGFTQERSNLNQLNRDFSPLNNKDFLGWLKDLNNEGSARILEIGGGIEQIAAQEILGQFPQLDFWEIELRAIKKETKSKLEETNHYHLLTMGFSQALSEEQILEQEFSIIFVHNVLNHLPNPFFVIKKCYQFLVDGGILFVNEILIYEEEWEKITNFLSQQEYHFSWQKKEMPSNSRKKGIVSISFTIKKTKPTINIPIAQGDQLTDYSGTPLGPYEFFFKSSFSL